MRMSNPLSVRRVGTFPRLVERACSVCIALIVLVFASPAIAEKGKLRERLTPEVMAVVYPGGADRLGPGGRFAACDRGLQGRQGRRLCVFDPRYHCGSGLFDDAVRRDRRRRSRRPHHRGQGGVPQRALYRSRPRSVSACSTPFSPAKPAGRCAAAPMLLPPDFVAGATVSARAMRAAVLDHCGAGAARAHRAAATRQGPPPP